MISSNPGIYMLKNKIGGLEYIGQATNLKRRINRYKNNSDDNRYISNSIRYYGWDNFEVIILHENVPLKDLNWLEKQCIWTFNTLEPNGYNLKDGGDSGGLVTSEKTKQKMRDAKLGEKNPNYGKSRSEDTKKKISKSLKGYKQSKETVEKQIKAKNLKMINGISFSNWIKENNIIQKELAKQIGCGETVIMDWKKEKKRISPKYRQKWIDNLGFDPIEKFGAKEDVTESS